MLTVPFCFPTFRFPTFRFPTFRLLASLVLSAMMLVGSGCAHTLGAPPTDLDLRNDGSPQARGHLYGTYQVTYGDGQFRRPSSTERVADAASDDAANYINTSKPAQVELETAPVAFDRFMHSGSLYSAFVGMGVAAGIVTGLSTSLPAAFDVVAADKSQAPNQSLAVTKQAALGALVGAVAAIPLVWLTEVTITPVLRSVAASDYRAAAQAFNTDLQTRIKAKADSALAPAAEAPADVAPPAPEAPRDGADNASPDGDSDVDL